eukprot:1979289-Prymnesium_polylepis.1
MSPPTSQTALRPGQARQRPAEGPQASLEGRWRLDKRRKDGLFLTDRSAQACSTMVHRIAAKRSVVRRPSALLGGARLMSR